MSHMKRLFTIIEEWTENDPTGFELLKDEINEHIRGKKKFHDMSMKAQLCFSEWEESEREAGQFYQPEQART